MAGVVTCLQNTMSGIFHEGKQRYLEKLFSSELVKDAFATEESTAKIMDTLGENSIHYIVRKIGYGKAKLFKKRTIDVAAAVEEITYLEVITYDNAYEIVMDVHCETGHGSSEAVFSLFQNKYVLPLACVRMVIEECEKCSSDPGDIIPERGIGEWRVSLINVRHIPMIHNPKQNDVLCIIDTNTNFIILRPAPDPSRIDLHDEFNRIIGEFGYPEKIYVAESLLFIEDIIELLWDNGEPQRVKPLVELANEELFLQDEKKIVNEFKAWSLGTDDGLLSIGCQLVQFTMNTTLQTLTNPVTKEKTLGVPLSMFYRKKNMWENYYYC